MSLRSYLESVGVHTANDGATIDLHKMRNQLRALLFERLSSEKIAQLLSDDVGRAKLEVTAILEQCSKHEVFATLSVLQRSAICSEVADMVLGFGPLEELLNDSSVTEIMVNGAQRVFYERNGQIHSCSTCFYDDQQLRMIIDRIVGPLGRRVDEQSPLVCARLSSGHRVHVVIPPLALDGPTLTIRKFREKTFTLQELADLGSLDNQVATLLHWAVLTRRNIAVSGGTGGGKTTLLNALSVLIPHNERIITIEDAAELRFSDHPHVVRLEARPANAEGTGQVTIRELVINALRMRPDRIVVGECRGAEALDMLQAMNTGHDGSLTTLHANSPYEVINRLIMMSRYGMDLPISLIEEQIASALDLIVQMDRFSDGTRRVSMICACTSKARVDGATFCNKSQIIPEVNATETNLDLSTSNASTSDCATSTMAIPIVQWDSNKNCYTWLDIPEWTKSLLHCSEKNQYGIKVEEVKKWFLAVTP
ncbi:MAG: CpaF family protein [Coriobacteriales bacterium]|jgi:pilus assembly protein CpaF|nr:CpaF family protein [Coriobacteriales bacterium]